MTALAVRNRLVPTSAPRVLALVADAATEATARMASAELGLGDIAVEGADLAAAAERLKNRASPSVLIVDVDGGRGATDPDPLDGLNHLAEACDPGVKVVAVGTRNDIAFYRALLQAGVADYLVKPITTADIVRAVREGAGIGQTATAAIETHSAVPKPRRLVAVVGVRGGVGATSIAVNLGLALGVKGDSPATLLDLDLRFGTTSLMCEVEPGSGLKELLSDPSRIDPLLVERACVKVSDELVLLAAEEPLDASTPAGGIAQLIEAIGRGGWVVADIPRDILLRERDCLAGASSVVLVADTSLVSLREVLRLKDWIASAAPDATLLIVANASRPKLEGDLPPAEFARASGLAFAATLPFDPKGFAAAARKSKPVQVAAPDSAVARAIRTLAERIAPETGRDDRRGALTLLTLWPGRRSKAKTNRPQSSEGRS